MKPWLLVDISYLAHRARYAMEGLEWEDLPTGVIYGFFEQLRHLIQDPHIKSNRIVFCFDSRKSFRKQAFPDYKRQRGEELTDDERKQIGVMHDQLKLLRTIILPGIGFQCHRQTGCESDDLMAKAAEEFQGSLWEGGGRAAIIITADGDLWQCISETVHWYDPARRVYHDPQTFKKAKGIDAVRWGLVKALAGCSGDGVPGIPGVGDKTAIRFLLRDLPGHYKTAKAIGSPDGITIFDRNKDLVILPHPKTKPFELKEPEYDLKAFYGYCERYGILSYLKEPRKSEWANLLRVGQIRTRKRGGLM